MPTILACRDDSIKMKIKGWVCSEAGKTWSIYADTDQHHVHHGNRHQHLQVVLKVDGVETEKYAWVESSYGSFHGPEVTPGSYREYKFAKPRLLVEDDDRPSGSGGVLDSATGTIEFTFQLALYRNSKGKRDRSKKVQLGGAVSEKSKKGAILGEAKAIVDPGQEFNLLSTQDDDRNPYCRLTLRYGSKDILQAMDILPGDAPPLSPESDDDSSIESSDEDEVIKPVVPDPAIAAAAAERFRLAQAEFEEARREIEAAAASTSAASGSGPKRKRGEEVDDKTALKKRMEGEMTESLRQIHGTTIDLTEEDDEPVRPIVKGETITLDD